MSYQHQDENVLNWLREMKQRIERLERGDKGVRVNDTRVGDAIITPNTYTNQIEIRNLGTDYVTPISSVRDITWSWPGDMGNGDMGTISPTACIADDTIASEIVISRPFRYDDQTGAVLTVVFPGLEIYTSILAHATIKIRPIHVPVKKNDLVYVRVSNSSAYSGFEGAVNNASLTIRFGQPSDSADNTTVETLSDLYVDWGGPM